MQMKHTKNLNPERSELGTIMSWRICLLASGSLCLSKDFIYFFFICSSSKGLKRKAKGKSEEKLKVKPKKFKKDTKRETVSGGKRKANSEEDGGNKVVKAKKRKSEEQQEEGKKTFSQLGKGKKKIGGKFDKGNKKWNGKGKFNSSKTKKQYSAAGESYGGVKKRKLSDGGQLDKDKGGSQERLAQ